jgi:hypothetical protein
MSESPERSANRPGNFNVYYADPDKEFYPTPGRVNRFKKVMIVTSQIPNAGYGMVVLENIKAGERIFEIKEPFITIVG